MSNSEQAVLIPTKKRLYLLIFYRINKFIALQNVFQILLWQNNEVQFYLTSENQEYIQHMLTHICSSLHILIQCILLEEKIST